MSLENAVVIKTFLRLNDADLAAARLSSAGIACLITTDDAGGVYPSLSLIKLSVESSQWQEARQILSELPVSQPPETSNSQSDKISAPPQPPFAKFGWGLLVGGILGALLHWGYGASRQLGRHTAQFDNDHDGLYDEIHVWFNGAVQESRYDRNADGRVDYWIHFRDGAPSTEEADGNFDGKLDAWLEVGPRGTYLSSKFDSDYNGVPDAFAVFKNGQLSQTDWRPNGTNVTILREIFEHGSLKEELRDSDGDGRFDVSVTYDPFGNPTKTNWLTFLLKPSSQP